MRSLSHCWVLEVIFIGLQHPSLVSDMLFCGTYRLMTIFLSGTRVTIHVHSRMVCIVSTAYY